MKHFLLKFLILFGALLNFFFFISCQDNNVVNPPVEVNYHMVKFIISGKDGLLANARITLDSNVAISDSNGFAQFDSIKNGEHLLSIEHKDHKMFSKDVTVNRDTNFHYSMELRSDSFFPLTIGSWWDNLVEYYRPRENGGFVLKIIGTEYKDGKIYSDFIQFTHSLNTDTIHHYYRMSGDTLFHFDEYYLTEFISAIFDLPPGSIFYVMNLACTVIYNDGTLYTVRYGQRDDFRTFRKGVGMIRETSQQSYIVSVLDYDIRY